MFFLTSGFSEVDGNKWIDASLADAGHSESREVPVGQESDRSHVSYVIVVTSFA